MDINVNMSMNMKLLAKNNLARKIFGEEGYEKKTRTEVSNFLTPAKDNDHKIEDLDWEWAKKEVGLIK